jgi:RimJ/RimL family protein N-acetyltransferase
VTFKPERLTPRNLHRLSAIVPTAGAPWWAADVENFLMLVAPNQVLAKTGNGLFVIDDDTIIAVAAHQRHVTFNAELLQAFLVLPEHRGKGLAALALECALTSIHSWEGAEFIMWLVHEENIQMRKASIRAGGQQAGSADDKGFIAYAQP